MIPTEPLPIPRDAARIVIFGGTFDPPHRGHIIPPLAACDSINADLLLYIPAARSPHKSNTPTIPDTDRLRLLARAIEESTDEHQADFRVAISTIEIDRRTQGVPSYTIDTLQHIAGAISLEVDLRLLIGADQVLSFDTWREPDRIIQLAEPVVMLRPPCSNRESFFETLHETISLDRVERWMSRIVPTPIMDVDATSLRRHLAAEQYDEPLVREGLTAGVIDIIKHERLYATNQ